MYTIKRPRTPENGKPTPIKTSAGKEICRCTGKPRLFTFFIQSVPLSWSTPLRSGGTNIVMPDIRPAIV